MGAEIIRPLESTQPIDHNISVGKHGANFSRPDGFVHVLPDPRPAGWKASWIHPRGPKRARRRARTNGDNEIAMTK